jgi:hypothetical protein
VGLLANVSPPTVLDGPAPGPRTLG